MLEQLRQQAALLGEQHGQELRLAGLVAAAALISWWLLGLLRGALKWTRVALGCRAVPAAPEGGLLGHTLALAPPNCAWEKMYGWLQKSSGILRVRILHRTGIVVSDPRAVKRIFQVRRRGGRGGRGRAGGWQQARRAGLPRLPRRSAPAPYVPLPSLPNPGLHWPWQPWRR